MIRNKISAHLMLTSESLEPEALAALTGLAPRFSGRKGDPIGGPGSRPLRHHYCEFSTAEELEELDDPGRRVMDSLIHELLDRFEPTLDRWRDLRESGEVSVELICEVWREAEYTPTLDLEAHTVRRVAALRARIIFDLYGWPHPREGEQQ